MIATTKPGKGSIVGAMAAVQLTRQLANGASIARWSGYPGIRTRVYRQASGRLYVHVERNAHRHEDSKPLPVYRGPVRAANETRAINRAVTRALRQLQDPVALARAELYALVETRCLDGIAWPPGLCEVYSQMTLEDVAAWTAFVTPLPLKAANATTEEPQ